MISIGLKCLLFGIMNSWYTPKYGNSYKTLYCIMGIYYGSLAHIIGHLSTSYLSVYMEIKKLNYFSGSKIVTSVKFLTFQLCSVFYKYFMKYFSNKVFQHMRMLCVWRQEIVVA